MPDNPQCGESFGFKNNPPSNVEPLENLIMPSKLNVNDEEFEDSKLSESSDIKINFIVPKVPNQKVA
jgi:hypothetical protein